MPLNSLPQWPPSLPDNQLAHLETISASWALAHGFVLLPASAQVQGQGQAPRAPTHAIPAPLSLFPTPFPKTLFKHARRVQTLYNALYARIALDWEFLDKVYGESIAKVDTFQGGLWNGWRRIREELVQVGCMPEHAAVYADCCSLTNWASFDPTIFSIQCLRSNRSKSSRLNSTLSRRHLER